MIYTDGLVVRLEQSPWAFSVRSCGRLVKEECGLSSMTTSSMAMEVLTVTRVLLWLKSQSYTHACIQSDSLCVIRNMETSSLSR
uniref:RNase H type-1 domain-containing protein n=1 Tax=Arion vulgaris TaxID=1028688 RepID=A0A0B6Y9M7_9EUPU